MDGLKIVSLGNNFNSYTCTQWSDFGASYPIGDDRSTAIWGDFGNGVVPRNVIVDSEGVVRYSAIGYNEAAITTLLDELLSVVSVDEGYQPESHQLMHSYPNPFNAGTQIKYEILKSGRSTLTIYDGRGQQVSTLFQKNLEAGQYTVSWNGLDEHGDELSSGIYFARLQNGELQETHKLVLLK